MRLAGNIPQVVVEAAGARVGPAQNFVDALQPLGFRPRLAELLEPVFKPAAIVERVIDCVEVRAAIHRDSLILLNAELHPNALEKRFAEFKDARPPVRGDALRNGAIQNRFGLIQGEKRIPSAGVAEKLHGLIFEAGFVKQAVAGVSVVVSAV